MKRVLSILSAVFLAAACFAADDALVKRLALLKKLDAITIPEVNFRNASIGDVLNTLSDMTASGGEKINILLMDPGNATKLTLSLKKISLKQTLKIVAETAGLVVNIDNDAVVLRKPRKEESGGGSAGTK